MSKGCSKWFIKGHAEETFWYGMEVSRFLFFRFFLSFERIGHRNEGDISSVLDEHLYFINWNLWPKIVSCSTARAPGKWKFFFSLFFSRMPQAWDYLSTESGNNPRERSMGDAYKREIDFSTTLWLRTRSLLRKKKKPKATAFFFLSLLRREKPLFGSDDASIFV